MWIPFTLKIRAGKRVRVARAWRWSSSLSLLEARCESVSGCVERSFTVTFPSGRWEPDWFRKGKLDSCESVFISLSFFTHRARWGAGSWPRIGAETSSSGVGDAVPPCHGAEEPAWSTMEDRQRLLLQLLLTAQLSLCSSQVLRIGERNSCLRTVFTHQTRHDKRKQQHYHMQKFAPLFHIPFTVNPVQFFLFCIQSQDTTLSSFRCLWSLFSTFLSRFGEKHLVKSLNVNKKVIIPTAIEILQNWK